MRAGRLVVPLRESDAGKVQAAPRDLEHGVDRSERPERIGERRLGAGECSTGERDHFEDALTDADPEHVATPFRDVDPLGGELHDNVAPPDGTPLRA